MWQDDETVSVWQEAKMGRKKQDKIREKDVTGLKYFDKLAPLLERWYVMDRGYAKAARPASGNHWFALLAQVDH